MFERYTEKARRAVFFARYEASQDGSPYIEMEQLLAGLLREGKNLLEPYLTRDRLQEFIAELHKLRASHRRPEQISTTVDLPLANACRRALAYAAEEAELLSHKYIGSEHMLLGMLREESSFPSLLTEFGITLEAVRDHLKFAPSEAPPRFGSDIGRAHSAEASRAKSFAEGCLEIVDTGGNRLAVIGLTQTVVIPRIGERLQLVVEGTVQKYRVVDVNYCYKINMPDSEYRVHHLSAVQVRVCPAISAADSKIVPDTT